MSENLDHVFMLYFTRVFVTEHVNEAAVLKCGCGALRLFTAVISCIYVGQASVTPEI